MLESIFVLSIAAGIIFFILGIEEENIIYSGASLLMWILVFAGHPFVQVPGDTHYYEIAFFAVSIGFIVINVIWMLIIYLDLDYWRSKEEWTRREQWMGKHR